MKPIPKGLWRRLDLAYVPASTTLVLILVHVLGFNGSLGPCLRRGAAKRDKESHSWCQQSDMW